MAMFENPHNFGIYGGTFNNVAGNYIGNQTIHYGSKDERIEAVLSANFSHEHYYATRHDQNRRKTTEGTCRWLSEDEAFLRWRDDRSSQHSILYIHGPPGSGKSTLCSQAIEPIANLPKPKTPLLAYHFCDYAQQFKEIETLSMIAFQLLERHSLAYDYPPLPYSILSAANYQSKRCDYVKAIIRQLVCRPLPSPTYFFLDGLDEELDSVRTRWYEAVCPVLTFLVELANEYPESVRLWISTQPRTEIRSRLPDYRCREIDLAPHAERDILIYLTKGVPLVKGPSDEERAGILVNLATTAETSFIWARLMLEEIQKKSNPRSILEFLRDGLPQNLTDYYQKMFDRFPEHLRPLASTVFSLIVYAKRPLRFCELWEATWAYSSKDNHEMNPADRPYEDSLIEVFQPFVERVPISHAETGQEDAPNQYICRLVHSTLKDFLVKHREVLFVSGTDTSTDVKICPEVPVTACLNYLLQSRFAKLLHKEEEAWVDTTGTPVLRSRFLIYSAKYWDRHLDDVEKEERQRALILKVAAFLRSPNFWTLMQVQSIWVQSHFSKIYTYSVEGEDDEIPYLRKKFPWWFLRTKDGFKMWGQYRDFLRHWRYFLCCGRCSGTVDSFVGPYTGKLHHIWTGALRQDHFLKDKESTVVTFMAADKVDESKDEEFCMFSTSDVDGSGDRLMTLRINLTGLEGKDAESPSLKTVMANATLSCHVQTWELVDGAAPSVKHDQTIPIAASTCDLHLYIYNPKNAYASGDRVPLAAFCANGDVLRIGNRVFIREEDGRFKAITGLREASTCKSNYIEEVSFHGGLKMLAVASRTKLSKKDVDLGLDSLHEDSDDEYPEETKSDSDTDSSSESGDDKSDSSDTSSSDEDGGIKCKSSSESDSDSDGVPSDDDSISEGSSTFSDDDLFEDDEESPWVQQHGDGSSDEMDSDDSGNGKRKGPGISLYLDSDSSDSDEEEEARKASTFGKNIVPVDDEEVEEWDGLPQYLANVKLLPTKPRSTLSLFELGEDKVPNLLFRKQFPRHRKIYSSPPAFHPEKSLVVWPLGDHDILFVDYKEQKSFTLRLRPSTALTCHISVQCSFSPCGFYMHIAALEGRTADLNAIPFCGPNKTNAHTPPPLHLAMLVSTYRLSTTKTTRSPPVLAHRVRMDLKQAKAINTRHLPFNLTWTADHLYVTESWKLLQVWRVPLFRDKPKEGEESTTDDGASVDGVDDAQLVMSPEKPVFMPQTCKNRTVRFFPPQDAPEPDSTVAQEDKVNAKTKSAEKEKGEKTSTNGSRLGKIVVGYEASLSTQPVQAMTKVDLGSEGASQYSLEVVPTERKLVFDPPLVCYLEKEKDLGNWVDSKARTPIPHHRGIGVLDRVDGLEAFDPDDDCDLEPYYY